MIELSTAGRGGGADEVGTVGALLMEPDGGCITGSDFLMDAEWLQPTGTANSLLNNRKAGSKMYSALLRSRARGGSVAFVKPHPGRLSPLMGL